MFNNVQEIINSAIAIFPAKLYHDTIDFILSKRNENESDDTAVISNLDNSEALLFVICHVTCHCPARMSMTMTWTLGPIPMSYPTPTSTASFSSQRQQGAAIPLHEYPGMESTSTTS
jgi:hypothetical protein